MAGYPVQPGHPPAITWEASRRRLRDSGTLSGTAELYDPVGLSKRDYESAQFIALVRVDYGKLACPVGNSMLPWYVVQALLYTTLTG